MNNKILSIPAFWIPWNQKKKREEVSLNCIFPDELKREKGESVCFVGFVYLKLRVVMKYMGLALSSSNLTEPLDLKTLRSLECLKGRYCWWEQLNEEPSTLFYRVQSQGYLLRAGFSELFNTVHRWHQHLNCWWAEVLIAEESDTSNICFMKTLLQKIYIVNTKQ